MLSAGNEEVSLRSPNYDVHNFTKLYEIYAFNIIFPTQTLLTTPSYSHYHI